MVLNCYWADGVSPHSLALFSWSLRTWQWTCLDAEWDLITYKSFQSFVYHPCSCPDFSSWKIQGNRSKLVVYCHIFQAFFFFLANFVLWNEPLLCCLIVLVICSAKLRLDILVLLLCCNFFPKDSCLSRHLKTSQFLVSEKVSVSEWFLELQFSFKEHERYRVGGKQLSALYSHLIRI